MFTSVSWNGWDRRIPAWVLAHVPLGYVLHKIFAKRMMTMYSKQKGLGYWDGFHFDWDDG